MNFLKIGTKYLKIIGSLALLYVYYAQPLGVAGYVWILAAMGFTVYAFFAEKERIESGNERFQKGNLFFRYGDEVAFVTLPIPVKDHWREAESTTFANQMIARIQSAFISTFGNAPMNGKQIVGIIGVTDSDRPSDSRGFLKISFTGSRGAIFSRFITYQLLGKNVVVHRLVYLLGIVHWYDIAFLVLASPITIVTWILGWFRGEHSLYASIAKDVENSFEHLDLRAYLESSAKLITDCIIEELKANDLFSAELGMLVNNVYNINNNYGNQITGGSGNSILGNIK